ncbi:MAG TPA: hypothetical protein VFA18_14150 [Gemmataceae bacterium]|nr:hypothetical protein [Gemmataceae bacterium]
MAYRAIWALADDPETACRLLRRKLTPASPVADPERVRQLVAQLDRPKFREREAATKALKILGPSIIGELRQALRDARSQEVRTRLQAVLRVLEDKASAANLRQSRAVQVLELARTPASWELLKHWASGATEAPLTQDAKTALARLEKK